MKGKVQSSYKTDQLLGVEVGNLGDKKVLEELELELLEVHYGLAEE